MKRIRKLIPYAIVIFIAGVAGLMLGRHRLLRELSFLPAMMLPDAETAPESSSRFSATPPTSAGPEPGQPHADPPLPTPAGKGANPPPNLPPQPTAAPTSDGALTAPSRHPLAHSDLHLVGADSTANEYWIEAINDPLVPANERKELIEDLNEAGLSDAKHPAPDDLPLIMARIQLIEAAAPHALDSVNAEAFLEVYKDLLNLAEVALGGGTPVR